MPDARSSAPATAAPPRPLVRSRLGWQIALILGPVAALAAAGIWALHRDEAAVREEARQRSAEVLGDVAERAAHALDAKFEAILAATNGSGAGGSDSIRLAGFADGRWTDPAPVAAGPAPPDWDVELSPAQRSAREAWLASAGSDAEPGRRAAPERWLAEAAGTRWEPLAQFEVEADSPPVEARVEARWIALALRAAERATPAPSGLPLAAVSLARSLQTTGRGLGSDALALLRRLVVEQPSLLTPWLLDAAARAPSDAGTEAEIGALASVWRLDERRRALGAQLAARLGPRGRAANCLWLDSSDGPWLVRMASEPPPAVQRIRAALIDAAGVRGTLAPVLGPFTRSTRAGPLPRGVVLTVRLAGRPLPWMPPTSEAGELMASVSRIVGDEAAGGGADKAARWALEARLTAPGELLAAQRRTQRLFGGLILGAAAAAGAGVWQTRAAYLRQAALAGQRADFIAGVSHELRAPLASLRLLSEGLAEGRVQDDAKRRQYAGFLAEETRRLSALVENVLEMSRIDAGARQFEFSPTDPIALVADAARLFEPLVRQCGAFLAASVERAPGRAPAPEDAGTPDVLWDAGAISRALANLLDNARKHAPSGTHVRLTLSLPPAPWAPTDMIRVTVADQGPGIPPEDHARIFERFYRRGSELRRETQGVGLGLAIVQRAVSAHGGRVRVDSEPGKGSAFTLELPVHPPSVA